MALLNLAACYDALGQIEDSIDVLETLVGARPTWKDAHYNLGVAYYKQKRYEDAITALRHELSLNGKNPGGARTVEQNPSHALARS